MSSFEKLSEDEFKQMVTLLRRFTETELDQFEQWKFESRHGPIYTTISLKADADDKFYTDLSSLIDE